LEATEAELEASKTELDERKAELDTQITAAQQLVAEITAEESEYTAAKAELEAQEEAVTKQINQLLAQLAAQNTTVVSESGYLWPLPGYTSISSYFGYRTHPVTGQVNSFHGGIDIPAPKNTKILASRSGQVIISAYNSSYGNYVVLNHGNNQVTLYAHMNSRAVSVGDTVKQGQVIGYVGTTGSSTGYHLHFEVRINGTQVNPLQFF
jgi:murein DD-endopeptidase MepM/ murein hydrolase activator NlpD